MSDLVSRYQKREKIRARNRPMPEIFSRKDIRNSGEWRVVSARAVRGDPRVVMSQRLMRVPLDDSELSLAIRGHEQIHVKISPQDLTPYINEATPQLALAAAEEARVNLIAKTLRFPLERLVTGTEESDGQNLAKSQAWSDAVYAMAAELHTGGLKPLLAGIRLESPVWADELAKIVSEFWQFQLEQIGKIELDIVAERLSTEWKEVGLGDILGRYGSTEPCREKPEWIVGMYYTVAFASLIESIATSDPLPQETEDEGISASKSESGDGEASDNESSTSATTSQLGEKQTSPNESDEVKPRAPLDCSVGWYRKHPAPVAGSLDPWSDVDELKDKPIDDEARVKRDDDIHRVRMWFGDREEWLPIKVATMPLTVTVPGMVGKKRSATNVGRNPRRIHRLITDPERRIFEKTTRGRGGIILCDVSGSMKLSVGQIKDTMLAAPGCTIIAYSWTQGTNTFILADKGKTCLELPLVGTFNGNDLPAIKYAVSRKTSINTPVIWITDGLVYRSHCGDGGAIECATYAKKNKIRMEPNPESAIEYMNGLRQGKAHKPQILEIWKDSRYLSSLQTSKDYMEWRNR